MFTGIVTDLGRVRRITRAGDTRLEIATGYDTGAIAIGASIACSGACLTVVDKGAGWFAADVSSETLACTTLGDWKEGTSHVDGVGTVREVRPEGDSKRYRFEVPPALMRYVAAKGSIAVDGVSLTVNEVDGTGFGVNIIPHTQLRTTFGAMSPGTRVNLEIDLVARYVARLLGKD
jgi:riboflavin synthase